ncbi:MAG: adenosylcobinamide amidohydrolase, partial [Syntrophaceticus sp.]
GELIGCAVKPAVKEALFKQTGLSPKMQHSVLRRLKRFGVNEDTLWQEYIAGNGSNNVKTQFMERLSQLDKDDQLVTYTSLYVHLLDQFLWELLSGEETEQAGNELLALVAGKFGIPLTVIGGSKLEDYIQAWVKLVAQVVAMKLE